MSGASSTLRSFETSFQQDLNGDGTVGLLTKTIESARVPSAEVLLTASAVAASKDAFIYGTHVTEVASGGYLPLIGLHHGPVPLPARSLSPRFLAGIQVQAPSSRIRACAL